MFSLPTRKEDNSTKHTQKHSDAAGYERCTVPAAAPLPQPPLRLTRPVLLCLGRCVAAVLQCVFFI